MKTVGRPNPVTNCPLTASWAAVGGKWKLTIIYWLSREPRHFAALRRQLNAVSDGVSQKVLAQQLHELMADDIVVRQCTGDAPQPVIYSLTEYGRSALPMLYGIQRWGESHLQRAERDRGEQFRSKLTCPLNDNDSATSLDALPRP